MPQVAFRPDFTRHKTAAPFKRNDQLLAVPPIGVVVFPGSGISDNLTDKAKTLGIPLFDFRKCAGGQAPGPLPCPSRAGAPCVAAGRIAIKASRKSLRRSFRPTAG